MKILLTKYVRNDGFQPNVFDQTNEWGVADYIVLQRIPFSKYPFFNETQSGDELPLSFVVSDFNLSFSLLSGELSGAGKNIYEFFFSGFDKIPLYEARWGETLDAMKYTGFIDLEGTNVSWNKDDSGWLVDIKVYGAEKMLEQKMLRLGMEEMPDDNWIMTADEYFNFLFFQNGVSNITLNQNFNWQTRLGWTPIVMGNIHNVFTRAKINDLKRWDILMEWAKQIGFTYKVSGAPFATPGQHTEYRVKLFFRTDGTGLCTTPLKVFPTNHSEGLTLKYNKRFTYIIYTTYTPLPVETYHYEYQGNLMIGLADSSVSFNAVTGLTNQNAWDLIFDDYNDNTKIVWRDKDIQLEDVHNIETQRIMFDGEGGYNIGVSLPRAMVHYNNFNTTGDGFVELINATAKREYRFLASGIKRTKKIKIYFPRSNDFELFKTVMFEGKQWRIDKIEDVDYQGEKATLNLIEI